MYTHGEGVPQDDAKAFYWYRKAAKQGAALAHYALGEMYHQGEGVPEDYVQAYAGYSIPTAQKLEFAKKKKDTIKKEMTPARIAEAQKLSSELWGIAQLPLGRIGSELLSLS